MDVSNPEQVRTYLQVFSAALTLIGFLFVILQIRRLGQSVRASAHAAIYAQAADFRSHLIAHPELRKYILEGEPIEPGHQDYARAVTMAEIFLNYLEHLSVQKSNFAGSDGNAWAKFAEEVIAANPLLQRKLRESENAYSPKLRMLAK